MCRIVSFRPWDSCGECLRDPHLWGFCGAAQAPSKPGDAQSAAGSTVTSHISPEIGGLDAARRLPSSDSVGRDSAVWGGTHDIQDHNRAYAETRSLVAGVRAVRKPGMATVTSSGRTWERFVAPISLPNRRLAKNQGWMGERTVFRSVRNSLSGSVATWAFSGRAHHVTQDHPAYVPRDLDRPVSAARGLSAWESVQYGLSRSLTCEITCPRLTVGDLL